MTKKKEKKPRNIDKLLNAEGHITQILEIMEEIRMPLKPDGDVDDDILMELENAIDSILYDPDFSERDQKRIIEMVNYNRGVDMNEEIIQYWIDEGFLNGDEFYFGKFVGVRDDRE